MSRRPLDIGMTLLYVGVFCLALMLVLWFLRGVGLLTILPGGILLLLLVLGLGTGVTGAVKVLKRY
ncbi:hypothetical protein [Leptolyngbya sp. FACHB-261]|uniref:hypothetical protein n=1 Tax=Leptolyngbya sp. FACHB-261 TaxID=2692806 RepID=UPI0016845D2A|nr:hypothetical protein [Leptolyngbya sp. FACHB-261]MBD2100571.1 hypothetical protein [Leptolyngbya sp. FACHB-261]